MATFEALKPDERTATAKDLGWSKVPVNQKEWDDLLHKSPIVINPATTKYVSSLCQVGWDLQSGAERSYIAQHSGSCPWSATSEKERRRLYTSTDPNERKATRQKICENNWNGNGPPPTLEEVAYLEATGGRTCEWTDISDAWKRRAADDSTGGKIDDTKWAPTFNAVCNRAMWNRTEDERRIVSNLCDTTGVCTSCEVRFATGTTERRIITVVAVVVIVIIIIILFK